MKDKIFRISLLLPFGLMPAGAVLLAREVCGPSSGIYALTIILSECLGALLAVAAVAMWTGRMDRRVP